LQKQVPDIFLSYSRNDSAKALALAEELRTNGMDVWIDQYGIEGATSWSKEIAEAIQTCHTMVLLLSSTALASKNVAKELSVATELDKRIVPVQIEPVELRGEFLYHLASLQRVKIADLDGIVRAIGKTSSDALRTQTIPVRPVDDRKSLMILPFQDLSPTADNQWFADGIVNELIASLSKVKSLRITDRQTTSEFRRYNGQLVSYAHQMNVRYFVQGDVRKFGDQIKISCSLLDMQTGDHLWQDSHKGTMNDIFDIQEVVTRKVVDGLKIHLIPSEAQQLARKGTTNPESYEMYLKAEQFFSTNTKTGVEYAMKAIERGLELDPNYALAMLRRAMILITYYREYRGSAALLEESEQLLERAKQQISPEEDWRVLGVPAHLAFARGQLVEAESMMRRNIAIDPTDVFRVHALAFFLYSLGRHDESRVELEKVLTLAPDSYQWARQAVGLAWATERRDLKEEYARRFIHLFLRRIQTMPDDDDANITYGLLLFYLGRIDEAREHAALIHDEHVDKTHSYMNLACLCTLLGQPERAVRILRLSAVRAPDPSHLSWLENSELISLRDNEDFIRMSEEWKARYTHNG
jgi:adenylate cyclase